MRSCTTILSFLFTLEVEAQDSSCPCIEDWARDLVNTPAVSEALSVDLPVGQSEGQSIGVYGVRENSTIPPTLADTGNYTVARKTGGKYRSIVASKLLCYDKVPFQDKCNFFSQACQIHTFALKLIYFKSAELTTITCYECRSFENIAAFVLTLYHSITDYGIYIIKPEL
jgi:hypothetical protein